MTEAQRTDLAKNAAVVRVAVQIAEALMAINAPLTEREIRAVVHAHRMQLRNALDAAISAGLVEPFTLPNRSTMYRRRTRKLQPLQPQAVAL